MICKVLRHKTVPELFGELDDLGDGPEVLQKTTPYLFPASAEIAMAKSIVGSPAREQLDEYELVEVNVSPVPTAIEVARELFKIHRHDDSDDRIYYSEADLLPILAKWGIPAPDWEGNAKEMLEKGGVG